MATNKVRGQVKVQLGPGATGTVGSAQTVTAQKLVDLAGSIIKKVKAADIPIGDNVGRDALLAKIQKEEKDFATSYPLILRWMVQTGEFVPGVFEKWLRLHAKLMYKNRFEFLEAQGEYLVLLHKHKNPRAGAKEIIRYREAVRKTLKEDDEIFTKAHKKAKKEVKKADLEREKDARERLYAYLKNIAK